MAGFPSTKKGNKLGEKAKQPHPGIPLDKDLILSLIIKLGGNLSRIAESIGSTRGCVRRVCENNPELKNALDDARERRLDLLEDSCFEDAINNHDTGLRCFLLKTQGRHRGYEQDDNKNAAKDIASAAFDFILSKSKGSGDDTGVQA